MNKSELVERSPTEAGLSKADADTALNAFIDVVQGAVAGDDKVTVPGFGTWSRTQRTARQGRNPRTGEIGPDPGVEGRQVLGGSRVQVRGEVGRSPSCIASGLEAQQPIRERW